MIKLCNVEHPFTAPFTPGWAHVASAWTNHGRVKGFYSIRRHDHLSSSKCLIRTHLLGDQPPSSLWKAFFQKQGSRKMRRENTCFVSGSKQAIGGLVILLQRTPDLDITSIVKAIQLVQQFQPQDVQWKRSEAEWMGSILDLLEVALSSPRHCKLSKKCWQKKTLAGASRSEN